MAKKKNSLVFMDVSIDGDPVERMVFEVLFFCHYVCSIVCVSDLILGCSSISAFL